MMFTMIITFLKMFLCQRAAKLNYVSNPNRSNAVCGGSSGKIFFQDPNFDGLQLAVFRPIYPTDPIEKL